jgi:hypothetical protein
MLKYPQKYGGQLLKGFRLGRLWRIDKRDLMEYIDRCRGALEIKAAQRRKPRGSWCQPKTAQRPRSK